MKMLQFGDPHLDRDNSGPVDAGTGLTARMQDYVTSLDRIMEKAMGADVDLVLFTGDAFDSTKPSMTAMREWARFLFFITGGSRPFVWVEGNHGMAGGWGKAHTADPFKALELENVYIVDRPELLLIETKSGPVQVVGIPWPTRHNAMASAKLQGVPAEQVDQLIVEAVTETIARLARQMDPEMPSFLVGHLSVEGGDQGGGTPTGLGREVPLPLEAVALPQFDYVALGHLHRYQELIRLSLGTHPPVIYSGSTERISFKEENEQKGFVMVDMGRSDEGSYTEIEFVPLEARRFRTIRVELDGGDPTAQVIGEIEVADIEGAMVRLIVEGSRERAALLDDGAINKALRPALKHTYTKDLEREVRLRLEGQSYEEMGRMELLMAYWETQERPEEEIETLVGAAKELMGEE